jgi:hypothetical protein
MAPSRRAFWKVTAQALGAVAVTPDGTLAVSGADGKTLRVCNLEEGGYPATFAYDARVRSGMAWTPLHLDRRLKRSPQPIVKELYGLTDMDAISNFGATKILCVEHDGAVLESQCAVLKYSGYDAASASPKLAEIVLRTRKFDLIVLSRLIDSDLHRIINFADSADVLVLDGLTSPPELLSLVAQRLNRRQRRA